MKTCERCGKEFEGVTNGRYCKECKMEFMNLDF